MTRKAFWKLTCASVTLITALQPALLAAQEAEQVKAATQMNKASKAYVTDIGREPKLTHDQKLELMRKNIKYVFVLFQENRSFDFYFGTYPGAEGLFTHPAASTPGFTQPIVETNGTVDTISPFLITKTLKNANGTFPTYAADTASTDHSHTGIDISLDATTSVAANGTVTATVKNDRYALNEEGLTTNGSGQVVSQKTGAPVTSVTLAQKQKGELVMSHVDCDTVPFLWQYANRFTMFDNFRQTTIGPSTPNAIAMIAGQSGETQWALHPSEGSNNTASPTIQESKGEPIVADAATFPGSSFDLAPVKPAINAGDENPATPYLNQTYASLPLSFMGKNIEKTIQSDQNPAADLADVQQDIRTIVSNNLPATSWGWYQEGYDAEPTDANGVATHADYVWHHNGPEYFGYVGDNPKVASNLHGLNDFFTDITAGNLPNKGGVFYVRGGYGNNDGLKPVDPNPAEQAAFQGSDDHPAYSDAQISEALVADEVNAIAASPYWKNSAIIITYDETDGLYDHVPPAIRSLDPEGQPLAGGPRIPAIVVSPYARVASISSEYSEHSSVIKFIDEVFNLTPLADLPDEVKGRKLGLQEFGQNQLGPADAKVTPMGDLFSAFDNGRLTGDTPILPGSYAEIPATDVHTLPHYNGNGCTMLGMVPTDYVNGALIDPPPADFNPRPSGTGALLSATN